MGPVESAFSGVGVYDAQLVLGHGDGGAAPGRGGCSYSAPAGDCEHVAFHACVNRRARAAGKKRLHIAPWMLALYDYDASPLKPAQLRSEPLLFDRSRYPSSCEYARRQAAPRIALPPVEKARRKQREW